MTALEVNELVVPRMGSPIVRGVSLGVQPGEVTVLLGPNGAGKTTLLEAISGVIPATSGSVTLADRNLLSMRRDQRARAGLSHVEQGRTVFPELTVEENLAVVTSSSCDELFEMFPSLAKRRDSPAGLPSGGEQQMLVIARALASDPQMLMIDEMSLGLAPIIVGQLVPMVKSLAERGIGVLLVEQFAPVALSIGHRAVVMSRGEVAYDGSCQQLLDEPDKLRQIYLGA
jgi:branched-chain amino acid transport system ATP-binding protein